jgi:hypothetical protein
MPIVKIIFDICLLRGRPQDLPASWNLFWLIALAIVATSYTSVVYLEGSSLGNLFHVVLHETIFGAVVWTILKVRGRPERWLQSIMALYAVKTLFNLITLPLLPQVAEAAKHAFEAIQQGATAPFGWELSFVFAFTIWHLLAMSQVMRHAAEVSFGMGVLISFFALVAAGIVKILFMAMFSIPVPT